jgi:hypothetical protein
MFAAMRRPERSDDVRCCHVLSGGGPTMFRALSCREAVRPCAT